jgi:hypothetical protein
MSGFWWSTSFWQGPHGPADHRRQQVRRLPVFSPGAAHRLAVQPDHQRGDIGEPDQHLDRQFPNVAATACASSRASTRRKVRARRRNPAARRSCQGVHVAWVWLLWSERRPTDRAVTGPMPHRADPNRPSVRLGRSQALPGRPGTRGAGDARGPRCHPGMLTPEESTPMWHPVNATRLPGQNIFGQIHALTGESFPRHP